MNLLFDIVINQGFILDIFGMIGLGLVALAALRIARHMSTDCARLMTWGALALIGGRVGFLLFGQYVGNSPAPGEISPVLIDVVRNVNIGLLTAGLGSIVWGFWRHEQLVAAEATA